MFKKNTPISIMEVQFYKENGIWYADVPEKTKEENEMVGEASEFLDEICEAGTNRTSLIISIDEPNSERLYCAEFGQFHLVNHDEFGGTYRYSDYAKILNKKYNNVWLCNVMHAVLGEHPSDIYVYALRSRLNETDRKKKFNY